ncbi:CBS domain-containing protein [Sorangium sp. So ce363]|uniref:CBS domain-containing protein n=1 Tax=Sorangium sp. So ce363 TaxID=3133304 RepID=UPI003F619F9C
MLCSQLMKSEPVCVLPDTTVQTAAQRMVDENIGFLPVCDASGKVLGALTDRDIAIRVVAKALPATSRVADVMTCEVVACRADEDIQQAEERMRQAQKSRIMCTDALGRLVGVISLSDIARSEPDDRVAGTLRATATREAPAAPGAEPAREARPIDVKSERVFRRIEQSGALPKDLRAPEAVGAVLCVLSLRVSGGEARDMAGALPPTLREIVEPCALHRAELPDTFGRGEFVQVLAQHLQTSSEQAEALARAVFSAVEAEMPMDEVTAVEGQLPGDLKDLWGRHRRAA